MDKLRTPMIAKQVLWTQAVALHLASPVWQANYRGVDAARSRKTLKVNTKPTSNCIAGNFNENSIRATHVMPDQSHLYGDAAVIRK
ncbi:hypothetical protein KZX46_03455 (plasmid) [Polymorphobacter sp. PAMC 29334]|uniref:hypothetical protein n=1 Tax=Polymorphobacter sp. PAMC 29334 TaxID=2862331 RepID=UPI001C777180|nr:hypothetical protein [Polymorphobacter sp. PAMC 29334]QYE33182.1 hypothetical protein KZX46_03455 [Polymorphobacter sp. PAMC 29334]